MKIRPLFSARLLLIVSIGLALLIPLIWRFSTVPIFHRIPASPKGRIPPKIVTGEKFIAALLPDSTIWTWGRNELGELGLGFSNPAVLKPAQVGKDAGWIDIAAGHHFILSIKTDHSLWGWGYHWNLSFTNHPTRVDGGLDWSKVWAYETHAILLKTNGTLWGFGDNFAGTLASLAITNSNPPTQLLGGQWRSASTHKLGTIALNQDGTIWVWGTRTPPGKSYEEFPPTCVGSDRDWVTVAAGYSHFLAIKSNGTLWAWGSNFENVWGVSLPAYSSIPFQIGTNRDWASVWTGASRTIAFKNDGSLWQWGSDQFWEKEASARLPHQILTGKFASTASGEFFDIYLRADGSIFSRGVQAWKPQTAWKRKWDRTMEFLTKKGKFWSEDIWPAPRPFTRFKTLSE